MNDIRFNVAVGKWQQSLEDTCQDMIKATNADGEYPQIDFSPLVIEFNKIIVGMEEGRKPKPSLILVPNSAGFIQ